MKYAEIIYEIERRLENGEIRGGQRLPSIREMKERHSCSKSTVIRAYAELEKRHLVYAIPQSGYYAVVKKPETERPPVRAFLDFSAPSPDPGLFPYLDFQHCLNKAIDMYRSHLFAYGTPQGLPSLLNVLVRHLAGYQVFARPEQLAVTSGVQQALSILAAMPSPNGRRAVLLEQPSYHLFIQLLACHGIPAVGIARTEDGIDLDRLEHLFRTADIKLFYTTPRFHNPLGTSYSESTKKAIAELAKRYGVYIAEDDYLADLETDTKSDPIHAYAPTHVVYLKSFSKILFPGLRVGAVVLPPELRETFSRYKQLSDIDSSMLSQAALEIYIQNGMFERRKQKIVSAYRSRMLRLIRALDDCNDIPDVRHARLFSGVHTHLELPRRLPVPALLNRLNKKGIILKEIEPSFIAGFEKRSILKLSITQVEEEQVEDGIRAVFSEIKRFPVR
ncbi:aminotransferase class I/II-fold pyridoxal phosphate-dependent enzyme [Cohnella sp. CFH 77786]|uniref:aminotransferase-like domain-containing protein n=1 Tax=Cohnella sp. CFH 77786 TaxID=2662265 RepID=UPI001C60A43F|nr:PLP-dependent aminotransferase family protein [Cohnella sp. CFH 77786]MBW5445389.1 aminotransferase class I/II-fold pyridoxal phosphate-dependent enzyme [Cohnella sp. CFH 77786]